ncbi:hypothetical protein [Methanosphaerula palustris]|nr:hypothetical protein [Methanosphaerula palustris]
MVLEGTLTVPVLANIAKIYDKKITLGSPATPTPGQRIARATPSPE